MSQRASGGAASASGVVLVRYASTAAVRLDHLAARWLDRVGERERRTLGRLRSGEDRRDLLAAHVLLRRAVGEWAGVDPAAVSIDHDAHGRPTTDTGAIDISLTHCRGLVACAVAGRRGAGTGVGIDAEPVATADRLATFTGDYLTAAELRWADAEPMQRGERLVQLWTAKEAVLKARGSGFARGDARSSLRGVRLSTARTTEDGARLTSDTGARVWSWRVGEGYLVSLACAGAVGGLRPPTVSRLSVVRRAEAGALDGLEMTA